MIYLIAALLLLSAPDLNEFFGEREFIETNSNKTITVNIHARESDTLIEAKTGMLRYTEALTLVNDTLYIKYRKLSAGLLSFTLRYRPRRPRIIFPPVSDTVFYEGTEIRPGRDYTVKSRIITMVSDSRFTVISETERNNGKTDISVLKLSDDYAVEAVEMEIPAFLGLYRLAGFKSPQFKLEVK
ncbi:MAG: hypothetical protein SVK54_00415 [candidate division WOR-3 bacterium]|nr:hypothetical protein [candidate division WOR-3 bacterium]